VIANGPGFHGWLWRLREQVLRAEIAAARQQWSSASEIAGAVATRCDEYPRIKYAVAARVVQARALGMLDRADQASTVLARARADAERCGEPTWQLRVHLAALACGDRGSLANAIRVAGDIERALPGSRAATFRASRELQILGR
jgi:hypothetical protein